MRRAIPLVRTWLLLDFFGDSRRTGGAGSTLTTAIFGQSFLALILAALLYPDIPPVPFAAANLSLSTLLMGLGTLGGEAGQGRREADRLLLATAPVSGLVVALARTMHGAFHVCLITTGMALPPAILLGFLTGDVGRVPLYVLCACLLAGLAVGALTLLLQVLRSRLGLARAALLSGTAKALLLAAGVIAFATALPALDKDAAALPIGRTGAELLPPYQAARFLAAPLTEWSRGLLLVGLGAILLGIAAVLRERDADRSDRVGSSRLAALHRRRLGRGALLGLTEFIGTMMYRSPGLRSRVLPLVGVPAAMVLLSVTDADPKARQLFLAMALQFPAIYLPFLVAFLPRADHPGTEWLFATSPGATIECAASASFLALSSHVLLPVHAMALSAMLALGETWTFAVPVSLFALGVGVLTARAQSAALDVIPFSLTEEDDGVAGEASGAFALALVLAILGAVFALSPTILQWVLGITALGAGIFQIGRTR